jgi:pSer/pThr/pTyr-binding forkhead associated (FHA) protein
MVFPAFPAPADQSRSIHLENHTMYGELQPLGGGDPIPLLKTTLMVGRRESADIVLRFPNVSGHHCEMTLVNGYWHVRDLGSSNGTKVNGVRVTEQRIAPGDKLSIAKHEYEVSYEPAELGASELPAEPSAQESIFGRSLLESAGLETRRPPDQRTVGRERR